MVAPNPLIGNVEDVEGGDLLEEVSAEVEANKFALVELIESFTPADDLPPKLNPLLACDDLLAAVLEGLGLIPPPNPAKGNEGASDLLFVDVTPLKSLFGNKEFAADDPEALSPEGNDAPKDEPNMLISDNNTNSISRYHALRYAIN